MSIEETKTNNNKLIFGGIFLGVISLIIIVCLFIFMSNCDSDYCTISDSVQDQITNTRVAIGISAGLLFLFGILHVSARTEKMKNIVHSTMFSGSWANVLFPVLSLTLLVSSIYLYTIVNGKNFVCIDDTGSTKSKRNSRYTSITTPINVMIGMSVLLLISSIFVLYKFWKKTDEEKLADAEKAKASLSKIDEKVISGGSESLRKKLDEIELALVSAKGLNEDEHENALLENLVLDVESKKNALEDSISAKKRDLEHKTEKLRESLQANASKISQEQVNKTKITEFQRMQQDDQKINFIYDNKNNAVLFEKLKETDFYKSNKDVIEETLKVGFEQMKKINLVLEKYKNFDKENGLLYIDSLCEDGSYKDILQYILSKLKLDLARNNGVRDFEYPSTCMSSNPGSIHQIADNLRAKTKQVQGVNQGIKPEGGVNPEGVKLEVQGVKPEGGVNPEGVKLEVQGVKPEGGVPVKQSKQSLVQKRIKQFEGEEKTDDMPSLEEVNTENPYNVADITHFGDDPRALRYFSRFKKLTKRLLKKH